MQHSARRFSIRCHCLSRDYGNRDAEPELAPVKRKYEEALQDYLLFRALADLRRSWRIVLPNLEQCALLNIDYLDLDEIVAEDGFWADLEITNSLAHPERREFLAAVLDYFRLEYAIHSENYLVPSRLKEFEKRFREQLAAPWTLDADEELAAPSVIRLDPLHRSARLSNKSMGPASSLGKYIKHVAKQSEVDPSVLQGHHYRDFIQRLMHKFEGRRLPLPRNRKERKQRRGSCIPASHRKESSGSSETARL